MKNIDFQPITNWINEHSDIGSAIHGISYACAGLSIINVSIYFSDAGLHPIESIAAGIIIGVFLVTMSQAIMKIGELSWLSTIVGIIGLAIAALSGFLQFGVYSKYLNFWIAAVMACIIPVVGEIVLPIILTFINEHNRRKENEAKREALENLNTNIEQNIADFMHTAISDLDPTAVKRYVEKSVLGMAKESIDIVTEKAMREYRKAAGVTGNTTTRNGNESPSTTANDTTLLPEINENPQEITAKSSEETTAKSSNIEPGWDTANDSRYRQIEERRAAVIAAITANGPLGITEIAEKLQDDFGITTGIGDKTLREDCKQLVTDGQLVKDGRKWDVHRDEPQAYPTHDLPVLPDHEVGELTVNGTHE